MREMILVPGIACPKCKGLETSALAREGDLQRHECRTCGENWSSPAVPEAAVATVVERAPAGFAHAPIAPPDSSDLPEEKKASANCPKCQKPYFRLGKRYEDHVAACDGTPWEEDAPKARRAAPSSNGAPIPEGTVKALDLSIEALKAQRYALESEIQAISAAIHTLEKLKGSGGQPAGPFPGGA